MSRSGIACATALAVLALAAPASAALTPQFVADINQGPSGSRPGSLTVAGSQIYFSANDGSAGDELWRSDGTTTTLVRDIRPGPQGSEPRTLAVLGNQVLFFADDGINGRELWRSDGTTAGTTLVADIYPGPSSSSKPFFTELVPFGGFVYFAADNGTTGVELWRSNGTTTEPVEDLVAAGDSFPEDLIPMGATLFFTASGDGFGQELWKTDGTPGSASVIEVNPGAAHGFARFPAPFAGYVYFNGNDGVNGAELWRTNGGPAELVDNINGAASSFPRELTPSGDFLYFAANDGATGNEVWRVDDTLGSAMQVADVNPAASSNPSRFTPFGSFLYFVADGPDTGRELWRTNGTTTELFADVSPGEDSSQPAGLTAFGGLLFFAATPGEFFSDRRREELFATDGSTTSLFGDLLPGTDGSEPNGFTEFGDALYFAADDGTRGMELWKVAEEPPDETVSLEILGGKLKLNRKRRAVVRLDCPAAEESGPCEGTLTLKTRTRVALPAAAAKRKGKRKKLVLARSSFSVAAGNTKKVGLKLGKKKAKLVRRSRKARKVVAIAKVADQAGNTATVRGKRKLVPKKARK